MSRQFAVSPVSPDGDAVIIEGVESPRPAGRLFRTSHISRIAMMDADPSPEFLSSVTGYTSWVLRSLLVAASVVRQIFCPIWELFLVTTLRRAGPGGMSIGAFWARRACGGRRPSGVGGQVHGQLQRTAAGLKFSTLHGQANTGTLLQ